MFRCKQSFTTIDDDGNRVRFGFGDLVPDGHWAVKGRESLFEPAEDAARVEEATAAPGERRSTRRRKTSDDAA